MGNGRTDARKKARRIVLWMGAILIAALCATLIPTLFLKTHGMKERKGEFITVYYESEEAAARDVFELADGESARIAEALGFDRPQDIRMYIYDRQSTFQIKKYGLLALLLNLDWYVGDNRGTDVLLTSPANPGAVHNYEEIRQAAIHEMAHAYNSVLNKDMSLWLNEGIALYLTNGNPRKDLYTTSYYVPSPEQMKTSNPVEFSKMGGYGFAHTYVEYLNAAFGWERVLELARTGDYEKALGAGESEIYEGWLAFLQTNYR